MTIEKTTSRKASAAPKEARSASGKNRSPKRGTVAGSGAPKADATQRTIGPPAGTTAGPQAPSADQEKRPAESIPASPDSPTQGVPQPEGDLDMKALSDGYLAHLEANGKSRGTVFGYGLDLGLALAHFGAKTPVANLTAAKVKRFFKSDPVTQTRTGKPKATTTIMKTRRVLRLALVWAKQEGLIPEVPLPEEEREAKKRAT